MAHLFFERLEKRFNTQSLSPFDHFLNLQELERWVGNSLLSQTRNSYQLNTQSPASYYSAYYGYNQYSSYPQTSSSFFPQLTTWHSWSNQWSPQTYPQSPWTLPMSLGTLSWFSPMYPRNFFITPTISPSSASTGQLVPVSTPPNTYIAPFTGLPGSYPPGTWYGLIKRSNLKV